MDAYSKPPFFILEDLMQEQLKGSFYAEQLRLAPDPTDADFIFEIESIEKRKKVKGEELLFVKYLFYPRK